MVKWSTITSSLPDFASRFPVRNKKEKQTSPKSWAGLSDLPFGFHSVGQVTIDPTMAALGREKRKDEAKAQRKKSSLTGSTSSSPEWLLLGGVATTASVLFRHQSVVYTVSTFLFSLLVYFVLLFFSTQFISVKLTITATTTITTTTTARQKWRKRTQIYISIDDKRLPLALGRWAAAPIVVPFYFILILFSNQ